MVEHIATALIWKMYLSVWLWNLLGIRRDFCFSFLEVPARFISLLNKYFIFQRFIVIGSCLLMNQKLYRIRPQYLYLEKK